MDTLLHDLRYAIRTLRKNPGFTAVSAVTLALGIGANTAVFSAVDAVLLQPPPYAEPDRLVLLWHRSEATGSSHLPISAPDVADYRARARLFEGFAFVASPRNALLAGPEGAAGASGEHVRIGRVSSNFFSVLGAETDIGRTFRPDESVLSAAALADSAPPPPPGVVVLGHALWRERFGADTAVVGRRVRIDGTPMLVLGVLEPDFRLLLPQTTGIPPDARAWTPLRTPLDRFRRAEGLRDQDSDNTGAVIGRLRRGTTVERARREMSRIVAGQHAEIPAYRDLRIGIDVVPLQADAVARVRPALLALTGAVALVLLIACLNVSNLLLGRAIDREREMAVRHALGAAGGRLARQLLTEAGVLGVLGAGGGLLLAFGALDLLSARVPAELPRMDEVAIDGRVAGFTLGIALAATLLAAAFPALLAAREAGRRALRLRGADTAHRALRGTLIISQVALCLTLLVGAGLLLRSFAGLQRVDPGFEPRGLVTFRATLPPGSVGGPSARAELMDRLLEGVREAPGVRFAGLVGGLPLGEEVWTQPYGLADDPPARWSGNEANFRVITSDYFRAMGTRLLAGRFFTEEENLVEERRVVIVDRTLAERIAPAGDAVGRRLGFPLDGRPVWAEVVGVVEPMRYQDLERPGRETLYVPYRQEASRDVTVAVRTTGSGAAALLPGLRRAAAKVASPAGVPVYDFRPMQAYVARALAPNRFALAAFAALALAALLLAVVGLYGVVSGAVTRRRREIGVRMALGADRGAVLRHFMARGWWLVAAGLATGSALSLALSRLLSGLLFGVAPSDPLTHLGVIALLSSVATAAIWVPARRASRVEPAITLRED